MGLHDGSRLRVVRGSPSPAEAVAVVLALDLARAADRPSPAPPALPGWRWAARLEGAGATQVVAAADLESARRHPLH